MTVTSSTFRTNYPEFASTTLYPEPVFTYWLGIANLMLNITRWSTALDYGLELFVAHNLVLERQAQAASAAGGVPGLNTGAVTGKTVGPGSITYDANAGLEKDAGHWNLSTYGKRFIQLARMMGSGGLQV